MSIALAIFAFFIDLIIGDPPTWPHPIRWIGGLISRTEKHVRRFCQSDTSLFWGGFALCLSVVLVAWWTCFVVIAMLNMISPALSFLVQLWFASTVLASRSLADAALSVYRAVKLGSIQEARLQLSYIVGRDTTQLSREQITRATVETVAENTVDGVIAPLFYLFIGGVPLAMAYKAINTLDSMVGYKNEKYLHLGFASAKLDDIANFIPARLTWLFMIVATCWLKLDYVSCAVIGWRDRRRHKSPNCAWPEGAVAGALGIQLGGPNIYFGQLVDKPWIGDNLRQIDYDDILVTNRLMYHSSLIALVTFTLVTLILR